MRIAVVGDDRIYCEGLRHVLQPALLVAVHATGGEAEAALLAARPEVVLLDARLEPPLELCRTLRGTVESPIVFVAAPEDDAWAARALEAGASGVLGRSACAEELRNAVRVVCSGGLWARRQVLSTVMRGLRAERASIPAATLASGRLSSREREVFRHAAMGLANKELADRLAISEATVKVHLTRIFQKLGVHGRGELAAAYHGLIDPARPRAAFEPDVAPPVATHASRGVVLPSEMYAFRPTPRDES